MQPLHVADKRFSTQVWPVSEQLLAGTHSLHPAAVRLQDSTRLPLHWVMPGLPHSCLQHALVSTVQSGLHDTPPASKPAFPQLVFVKFEASQSSPDSTTPLPHVPHTAPAQAVQSAAQVTDDSPGSHTLLPHTEGVAPIGIGSVSVAQPAATATSDPTTTPNHARIPFMTSTPKHLDCGSGGRSCAR